MVRNRGQMFRHKLKKLMFIGPCIIVIVEEFVKSKRNNLIYII